MVIVDVLRNICTIEGKLASMALTWFGVRAVDVSGTTAAR
jgi:hypothetical protein